MLQHQIINGCLITQCNSLNAVNLQGCLAEPIPYLQFLKIFGSIRLQQAA